MPSKKKGSVSRKRGPTVKKAEQEPVEERLIPFSQEALTSEWKKAAEIILGSIERVIRGMVDKASEGNPQAARFVFEFIGASPELAKEIQRQAGAGSSLAAILLEELERLKTQSAPAAVTQESPGGRAESL